MCCKPSQSIHYPWRESTRREVAGGAVPTMDIRMGILGWMMLRLRRGRVGLLCPLAGAGAGGRATQAVASPFMIHGRRLEWGPANDGSELELESCASPAGAAGHCRCRCRCHGFLQHPQPQGAAAAGASPSHRNNGHDAKAGAPALRPQL